MCSDPRRDKQAGQGGRGGAERGLFHVPLFFLFASLGWPLEKDAGKNGRCSSKSILLSHTVAAGHCLCDFMAAKREKSSVFVCDWRTLFLLTRGHFATWATKKFSHCKQERTKNVYLRTISYSTPQLTHIFSTYSVLCSSFWQMFSALLPSTSSLSTKSSFLLLLFRRLRRWQVSRGEPPPPLQPPSPLPKM